MVSIKSEAIVRISDKSAIIGVRNAPLYRQLRRGLYNRAIEGCKTGFSELTSTRVFDSLICYQV